MNAENDKQKYRIEKLSLNKQDVLQSSCWNIKKHKEDVKINHCQDPTQKLSTLTIHYPIKNPSSKPYAVAPAPFFLGAASVPDSKSPKGSY